VVSTPRISIGPAGRWAARRRVRGLVGLSLSTRAVDPCLGATLRTPFKLLFITILNILYVYCSGYASVTVTAGPGPGRFGNVWKPGQSTVHPLRPVLYIYLPTPAQLRSST